jgi:hypothetical protein
VNARGALILVLAVGLAAVPAPAAAQLPPLPPVPGNPQPQPQPEPAPPQPPPASPGPGVGFSYFGNPGGNAAALDQTVFGPLQQLWTKTYKQLVNQPLVVGDKVVVNVNDQAGYGSEVIAYDLRTGTQLWRRATPGVYFTAHIAASDGRVVAVNHDGVARAFALADGMPLWEVQTPHDFGPVPVAADGVVYIAGQNNGPALSAYSIASGAKIWSADAPIDASGVMPVLDGDRVYVAVGAKAVAFSRATGKVVWAAGQGGRPDTQAALHAGRLHASGSSFDPATGAEGGMVGSIFPRAFAGPLGIGWDGKQADGVALDGTGVKWTFKLPGTPGTGAAPGHWSPLPLVVGPTVYVAGEETDLFGLDAASGAVLSRTKLPWPNSHVQVGGGQQGMATGGGVLVVSHGLALTAFAPVLQPPPGGTDVAATKSDLSAGQKTEILGGIAPDARTAQSKLELESDAFPFRRYSSGATIAALADGTGWFDARPQRNTRFRIRSGRAASRPITVYVLPRISSSARATSRTRGIVRAKLRGGRGFNVAGRRLVVYHGRVRAKRFELLGSARLRSAGRGRAVATVPIRLPRKVGGDDTIMYCTPGLSRLGYGRRDLIDRRCGRARIPFEQQ